MGTTFYAEIERIIQDQGDAGLDQLEYYYGLSLDLYRPNKSDVYSRVHGSDSGSSLEKVKEFTGILQGDDFFPSNSEFSGGFIAGFLYTRDNDIMVGDVISVNSKDDKVRRYKIDKREQIGLTREIITKWGLSSIGD